MKNNKIQMTVSRRVRLVLALSAITILAAGCGQQAYREGDEDSESLGGGGSILPGNVGGGMLDPVTGVTSVDTLANLSSDYSFHFKTTGSGTGVLIGGGTMNVVADTSLKIRITAGDGLPLQGTGYTVGFNCQKFTVKVGNVTKTAFVKKANYTNFMLKQGYMSYDPCASAGTTWIGDFSNSLNIGQRNERTIVVSNAQYDNCRLYGDVYDGGCGMSSVYSTHAIDANMDVFSNQ